MITLSYIGRFLMKRVVMPSLMVCVVFTACYAGWLSGYSRRAKIEASNETALADQVMQLDMYYNVPLIEGDGILRRNAIPTFKYSGTHSRTYFGFYDTNATIKIRYFDNTTKALSAATTIVSSWGSGDDHSVPSVIVLQRQTGDYASHNGKVLVAAGEHGTVLNGRVMGWRSSSAESISSFETGVSIEDKSGTYTFLVEDSAGKIYLFYRLTSFPSVNHFSWYYKTSTDAGTTWSSRTLLWDAGDAHSYIMVYPTNGGEDIHLAFNAAFHGEPYVGYSRYRDIYYARYDVSGAKWYKADGTTEIALPMDTSTAGSIPDVVHTTAATHWEFLGEVKVIDGSPYILSFDEVPTDNYPSSYVHSDGNVFYHYYSGGTWHTETVCGTGRFGTYNYQAGATLDAWDENVIYACVPDGSGLTQMQKWEKDGTWGKTEDITQASSGDHFWPSFVNGASSTDLFKVLWCYTENYTMYDDGHWTSSLMAYPGYNNSSNIKLNKDSRVFPTHVGMNR